MHPSKRSPCPVACTLDIIGDKWTLLIIRDLACGKALFKEFLHSPEKIATNILTDRLQRLTEHQLIEKTMTSEYAREGYALTKKGKTLLPVLQSIADWGMAHIKGTRMHMKPKL